MIDYFISITIISIINSADIDEIELPRRLRQAGIFDLVKFPVSSNSQKRWILFGEVCKKKKYQQTY